MSTCGAIGALTVGGRVVGQVKCDLEAGHDEDQLVNLGEHIPGGYREPRHEWIGTRRVYPATPHAMTLTWTPEAEPDLDLFDPDEEMDVAVPFDVERPARRECQLVHDFGFPNIEPACKTCGMTWEEHRARRAAERGDNGVIPDVEP
tara:strand:+ start:894 stop:1334 length:441 start_codon:yes stop_codon:yes gene_type:complete